MGDVLQVRIFDEEGRLTLEGRHQLPVTFGRSPDRSCRFDDVFKEVSRRHATVSEEAGALVLADKSVNGTSYAGRLLQNSEVAIRDEDEFQIRQFRVEVKRVVAPKQPVAFKAVFITRNKEQAHPVGPTALLLRLAGSKANILKVAPRDPAATLAAYPDTLALLSTSDGLGIIATAPLGVSRGLTLNRGKAPGGVQRLRLHDVVNIGNLRIEILDDEHRAIRCKNPTCQLLNPYQPRENCKYCGHRLVEGETRFFAS